MKPLFLLLGLGLCTVVFADDEDSMNPAALQKNAQMLQQQTLQQTQQLQKNLDAITSDGEADPAKVTNAEEPLRPPPPKEIIPSPEKIVQSMNPEDLKAILENPVVKRFLKVMGHPDFFPNINLIRQNPNLRNSFLSQVGFFLFMFLFRTWRLSSAQSFFGRLWVSLYCFALLWSVTMYYIPLYMLGSPYKKVLLLFWDTFTK